MSSRGSDAFVHLLREPEGAPEGAIVLLHGRGADERDLRSLIGVLDPRRRLLGITPRGPLSLPPGGAHWYVVPRVGFPDPTTFHETFAALGPWLDAVLAEHGVPLGRTILGGFSQGAVMAYALTLGAGRPSPAALVALSGFIPTVEGFDVDLPSHAGVPVAIGHGTHDPVIDVAFARDARERLEGAGFAVTYRETAMPHTVDPDFVHGLAPWVDVAVPAG